MGAFEPAAGGAVPAADGALEEACPGDGTDGAAQGEHDFGGRANVDGAAGGHAGRVRCGDGRCRLAGRPGARAEGHGFEPALEEGKSDRFVLRPASGAGGKESKARQRRDGN